MRQRKRDDLMLKDFFSKLNNEIVLIMEVEFNKSYIHTKTGRPYTLVTNNFMFNEPHRDSNGEVKYEWRRGLCLYKAEYENPDGKYFARTREDFYDNFEPMK